MKDIRDSLKSYQDRQIEKAHGDFPSYEHEIAWMLAEAFDEPYGFWVRNVQYSALNAGQIKHEFENLQGKGFTRRQKAKMLMTTMKVIVHEKK
jgi:hypothetical protein